MRNRSLPNVTLIALAASYLVQIGAGVFALAMIGRVVSAAPPRSLAILHGAYRYDSSAFWQIVPPITGVLFLMALVANWRTQRRALLLGAFALFVVGGVITVMWLEPIFAELVATGYRDAVDPLLQRRAASWFIWDCSLRGVDAAAGVALLVALTRPAIHAAPASGRA